MTADATFGAKLRRWRGRAAPSREMVDRLAAALDVPLRQHNVLLLAAGFAPEWRQRDLAEPDLAGVASALEHMLAQQEPYPAVVVDRHWNRGRGGWSSSSSARSRRARPSTWPTRWSRRTCCGRT
jgi:transcriptional regulator with XRE-family HTH domain